MLAQKHFDMALFYQSVRRFSEAEEELKKAIELHKSCDFYLELARIYFEQQKYTEALQEINKALSIDPQNQSAHNLQAQCLQSQENFISSPLSGKTEENKIIV